MIYRNKDIINERLTKMNFNKIFGKDHKNAQMKVDLRNTINQMQCKYSFFFSE